MNNRILLSILVLLTTACLCVVTILCVSGGLLLFDGDQLFKEAGEPEVRQAPLVTPTPTAAPPISRPADTATPPDTEIEPQNTPTRIPLDAGVLAQMEEIERQVSRLRGLNPLAEVQRSVLTPAELRRHVEEEFFADYQPDEVADDVRVLAAFGLLDEDFDLYDLYLELYSEQIAGFYDSKTKEMYVVQGQDFSGPERSTYAHEFTHVLQDQHYDLRDGLGLNHDSCRADSERCAAITALIEGDAVLSEQYWLYVYGTRQDQMDIERYYQNYSSPVYDTAPAFLQEDFAFPYREGVEFVFSLFDAGGFPAVDAAYANPPLSTEMILHPEKYPDDIPLWVDLPDFARVLNRPLRELDRGVLGEWYAYLVLAHGRDSQFRLDADLSRQAAAGWGGDAYAVYSDEDAGMPVMALYMVWDNESEAREFQIAIGDYARLRFGSADSSDPAGRWQIWENTPEGAVLLQAAGEETLWVIAPSLSDAQALADVIGILETAGAR